MPKNIGIAKGDVSVATGAGTGYVPGTSHEKSGVTGKLRLITLLPSAGLATDADVTITTTFTGQTIYNDTTVDLSSTTTAVEIPVAMDSLQVDGTAGLSGSIQFPLFNDRFKVVVANATGTATLTCTFLYDRD